MLAPEIRPNMRDDLFVTDGAFRDRQRTAYSGRLHFGPPGQRGAMQSPMEFTGLLYLPDSFTYRADRIADATVVTDFWVQACHEYLFTPHAEAHFAGDETRPGKAWIQLGLTAQGYSGAILGYRVTVTVGRDAVVTA